LPDFAQLVNFPDKGKTSLSLDPGAKQCVMCGKFRRCSAGSGSNQGRRSKSARGEGYGYGPEDETTHIIPRQNKGICTVCDVSVWVVQGPEGLEIKWCKGCKNFRPWAAFGEKGGATKCARCRKRQKEKYATQKVSYATQKSASSGRGGSLPMGDAADSATARKRTVKGTL
jgi:hypothetical protein